MKKINPFLLSITLGENGKFFANELLQTICEIISDNKILQVAIVGYDSAKHSKLYRFTKLLKTSGVSISLDILPKEKNLNVLKQIKETISQIRVPVIIDNNNEIFYFKKLSLFLDNIKEVKFSKPIIIFFPIDNKNIIFFDKILTFCQQRNLTFSPLPLPKLYAKDSALSMEDFWQLAKKVSKAKKKYDDIFVDFAVASVKYENLKGICPGGKFMVHSDIEGNIYPCYFSPKYQKIGTLKKWHNKKYINIEKNIHHCTQECIHFEICNGGCLSSVIQGRDYYCLNHS